MTHPLQPTNCIAVEVPTKNVRRQSMFVNMVNALRYTEFEKGDGKYPVSKAIPLPEGEWGLVGIWPFISEERARGVVQDYWNEDTGYADLYRNYTIGEMPEGQAYDTATESLHSLLASNSLDPSKRYAILKPI